MTLLRRLLLGVACLAAGAALAPATAQGVEIGAPSRLARLVPAELVERQAEEQFEQLKAAARRKGALASDDHPELRRLRAIAQRLIAHAGRFSPRAPDWDWELALIASDQINALCMPGGKIVLFTGILERLELEDAEVAAVIGHEMAHALREHARERIAKSQLTRIGASLLGEFLGGGLFSDITAAGGNLLTLKFSRQDESESDLVGLELAARAGYDPRAGISLWQKMQRARRGGPPQWLSTHPSGERRIEHMRAQLPRVMPLFERSGRG